MALLDYDNKQLHLGDGILASTQEENWDWYKKHVERAAFPDTIASPESTLVMAGPATYEEIAPVPGVDIAKEQALLTPVGFLSGMVFREGSNIIRLGEIGSRMPRFAIDRTAANGQISRALFNASNLAYVLYQNALKSTSKRDADSLYIPVIKNAANTRFHAGLWTDMFRVPFGMCVCFRTIGNDFLASVYLEQCYITSQESGTSIGQAVVLENIQFEIERIRAVKVTVEGSALGSVIKDTGSG